MKYAVQLAEAEYNSLHELRFREYIDNLQTGFKENPSSFWSFVNSRKRSSGIPVDVTYGSRSSSNGATSANLFADFFQSVFEFEQTPPPQQYIDQLPSFNIHLPQIDFDRDAIYRALCSVDASKGPGPDQIPPSFIKNCAASLANPVMSIFNRSLIDGVFPNAWKLASITPIFKSGSRHNVENYRPISILNCLAKVLESLLHDKLYPAVQSIISEFQHGFMKKRSTTSNLMSFTSTVTGCIEKRQQVDAVYIDFSKAFDKVPHDLAIKKLSRLGLPPWIVGWLKSYLSSRKAFVKVHDARSDVFNIPSGVPQ